MRRLLRAGLLAALCTPLAQAQDKPADDLYQDALQSIAEGRKADAFDALTRVIQREPEHAGAWLDLALIQCGLGNDDEAQRLFAVIETRFNPPPGILEVIAAAREQGCQRWQARSAGTVTLARGHDRNVNQGTYGQTPLGVPLPEFLPKADSYVALSGDYLREISANGSIGFVQLMARRNDHLDAYDNGSVLVGVETPWRFGGWTLRQTTMLSGNMLGGSFYQRQAQLQARLAPPLPLPGSWQASLLAGLSRTEYLTLENFNANTVELRGQFSYTGTGGYAALSLGVLEDHGNDLRPGGVRRGQMVNLRGRTRLGYGMTGELGYTLQTWKSKQVYSPGVIDLVRDQATHVLRGVLSYPVRKDQQVLLEARAVRNKENISVFQYNERQLQLSWQWQLP